MPSRHSLSHSNFYLRAWAGPSGGHEPETGSHTYSSCAVLTELHFVMIYKYNLIYLWRKISVAFGDYCCCSHELLYYSSVVANCQAVKHVKFYDLRPELRP